MVKENDYNFSYTILFLFCLRKFEATEVASWISHEYLHPSLRAIAKRSLVAILEKEWKLGGGGENKAWYNLSQKRRTGPEIVPPVTAIYGSCNQFD